MKINTFKKIFKLPFIKLNSLNSPFKFPRLNSPRRKLTEKTIHEINVKFDNIENETCQGESCPNQCEH